MKRILVVEDEASIRELVALNLKMTGWEVLEAPSAERALELIQKNPPCDVALLDIMLPGMDGFSLCETIRHGDPYIGIIMASAKGQESDKIRGLSIGADDYITKPFSVRLVRMRVEAVLRRVQERENKELADVLSWGNIRLERSSRSVTVSGKAVGLTNTEYGLLELFLLHPGRVFTRDNLLNQVWGYDFVGEEKTVNIHIMNLRRKLNTDCLQTVRGVGYKLVQENQK